MYFCDEWSSVCPNYLHFALITSRCGANSTAALSYKQIFAWTTTSVGLAGGLRKIGKKSIVALHDKVPGCLFRSFIITPSPRLIIFPATPGNDRQFHPIDFIREAESLRGYDMSHVEIPVGSKQ